MAALSAVAPVVAKVAAVTTTKAANNSAMMVWQPHNNKYVASHLPFRASQERIAFVPAIATFPRSRLSSGAPPRGDASPNNAPRVTQHRAVSAHDASSGIRVHVTRWTATLLPDVFLVLSTLGIKQKGS
jgi:hypothetical protein